MKHALDLWSFQGSVRRRAFLAAGLGLFAAKYPLDLLVSRAFHHAWSPLMYLSPRVSPLLRPGDDATYWLVLLAVALPFIAAGLSLSARRLRDMGLHPFWAGLFFLPFLHFVFFLALVIAPSKKELEPAPEAGPYRTNMAPPPAPPRLLTRLIPQGNVSSFLFGQILSLLLGLGAFVVTVQVHESLGAGLFVGVPFGMGFMTAFTTSYGGRVGAWRAIFYGSTTVVAAMLALLAVAWEGIACIVMASPILLVMSVFGALCGWLCTRAPMLQPGVVACVLLVPAFLGLDIRRPAPPEPLRVVSTVTVNASPEQVWRSVVSFPPIDAPPEAIFAIVAMPIEARIDGHDPGATRRCIFTNGTFIEPIRVWQEPRELTFGVQEQPAGLDRYIDVTQGQFLLTANPDGTTTLRGTTWYRLRVFPLAYWRFWTETFLHAIHLRVLEHVKRIAEHPDRATKAAAAQPPWMQDSNATCNCTIHRADEEAPHPRRPDPG